MSTQTLPEVIDADPGYGGRFVTLIYNNDTNTFDEVIEALMRATGCAVEEAYMEAWEARMFGKAPVHFSSQEACCAVATMVGQIGLKTEVRPEWED